MNWSSEIRQTDWAGNRLPFTTDFKDRWNRANSASEYEPCTSISGATLVSLGLDPESVEDTAVVDGQTARGCAWYSLPPLGTALYISQAVGNSPSISAYKKKYEGLTRWRQDLLIDGRTVGVEEDGLGGCMTYVQSGAAGHRHARA